MQPAAKHPQEDQRVEALRAYHILDTEREQAYDDITRLASFICDTPMSMVSLVDEHRQWFKATFGTETKETSRDVAFCGHAILDHDMFVVRDTLVDPRFADNPLVTGEMHVRFYAGIPLTNSEGLPLGTLCVLDKKPRTLTPPQASALQALSRQAMALMEARRVSDALADALEHVKTLNALLPICNSCKRIRDDEGYWNQIDEYLRAHSDVEFTRGVCKDCTDKAVNQFRETMQKIKEKTNPAIPVKN